MSIKPNIFLILYTTAAVTDDDKNDAINEVYTLA